MIDLLIAGGTVLTVDRERRIIEDGAVAIDGDRIVGVGKAAALSAAHVPRRTIDARGKLVMPGLVNGHSHFIEPARGLIPDTLPTRQWLKEWAYPYMSALTPEDEYAHALNLIAEMVKSGTTCFVDPGSQYLDTTLPAVVETGMRCCTGPWTWDQAGPDTEKCWPALARLSTGEALGRLDAAMSAHEGAASGRVRIFATLEGGGTCSDDLLRGAFELAAKRGTMMLMHVASSVQEVEITLARTGHRPVEHLDAIGVLGAHTYLNHVVVVSQDEVERLARHDVKVCQNPSSALKLGKGTTRFGMFPEMLQAGVTVALGCDGSCCSDFRDMVRAMYLAATLAKDARLDASIMTAEKAVEMATIDGARALGWDDAIGSLEVGKKADVILLDTERPEWVPVFNVVQSLVYSATGDSVDTVIVDGRILMEGRVLRTIDEKAVIAEVQARRAGILRRSGLTVAPRWPVI